MKTSAIFVLFFLFSTAWSRPRLSMYNKDDIEDLNENFLRPALNFNIPEEERLLMTYNALLRKGIPATFAKYFAGNFAFYGDVVRPTFEKITDEELIGGEAFDYTVFGAEKKIDLLNNILERIKQKKHRKHSVVYESASEEDLF